MITVAERDDGQRGDLTPVPGGAEPTPDRGRDASVSTGQEPGGWTEVTPHTAHAVPAPRVAPSGYRRRTWMALLLGVVSLLWWLVWSLVSDWLPGFQGDSPFAIAVWIMVLLAVPIWAVVYGRRVGRVRTENDAEPPGRNRAIVGQIQGWLGVGAGTIIAVVGLVILVSDESPIDEEIEATPSATAPSATATTSSVTAATIAAATDEDPFVEPTAAPLRVEPAENPKALAGYLAAVYELDAALIEAEADPALEADYTLYLVIFDESADAWSLLDPPPEAQWHWEESVAMHRSMTALLRSFYEVVATGTDEEVDRAYSEYTENLAAQLDRMAAVGTEQSLLTMSVLATRPDIPETTYLLDLLTMESEQGGQLMDEVISAVHVFGSDTDAALDQMSQLADDFEAMAQARRTITPPPSLVDYHHRHIENLEAFAVVLRQMEPPARASDIPDSFVTAMEETQAQSQALGLERCRIIADVLHGISRDV